MTENTNPTPEAESELTGQFTRAGQQMAELRAQLDGVQATLRATERIHARRAARARKSTLMDAWEVLMDAGQTEAAALIRVMWDA